MSIFVDRPPIARSADDRLPRDVEGRSRYTSEMSHYFVIEGLIGVGKTSLCRLIEQEWGAELILEPAEDNPFLANFYNEPDRYAFPTQMFYLATRYAQQQRLMQAGLFHTTVVSDYLFEKDRLFAEQTLSGEELSLYDRFAGLLGSTVPRPAMVLFLDAPTSSILERIHRRGIASEQRIEAEYLNALRRAYYDLWGRYDLAPVYCIETTHWNYVSDPEGQQRMLKMIRALLDGRPSAHAPEPFRALTPGQLSLFERE
ncbi:MAG: deoxynucleoside kinase [Myxococcota bacterium]